jgi:UDPglucose 6-dehydrogenase|tara:strand:- start:10 stop:834 length:825 start_codon:yes stop_codon:yes gene_type:complete
MKIGIVGQGFVGTAINEGLKQHFQIETFDIAKECTCISLEQLSEKSDVVFVCLPTPMKSNGDCHLDIVENTLLALDTIKECKTIVVKSTIPPGTTEKWNKKYKYIQIVFNPEFLTEANSIEDFKTQNRIIIGGPRPATTQVKRIFDKAFPKVPIIKTGSTTAEMVKYFLNSFLATKVSFANEMYQICEGLNIDYDKVTEYAKYDERLGKSHLNVPGPDGDFGYGGHCFPKDVKALIQTALEIGLLPKMLIATDEKNNQVRKNRDWEKQKGRAII